MTPSGGQVVFPVRGGTGSASLAPPWSRGQVRWLGKGYYVLRLATEDLSRWLLGAGFRAGDVLPHERTFRRSATDKSELMKSLRMNPWPSHLVADLDPDAWRAGLSKLVEGTPPVFDTGHVTLWRLQTLPAGLVPSPPFVVLDGHHSRRAQVNLGLKRMLGWLEPLKAPQLNVRSIDRAGWLARWLDACVAAGELRRLSHAPATENWLAERSTAFEVVQPQSRWWCELARPLSGESAVDGLSRLTKTCATEHRVFLKASANFEEILGWIERLEVDTGLRMPPPTKEYAWSRALARQL
ncbi:MAG: hypothetical protein HY075_14835, partial [Deltaproteobacteria bacterium]|nr:hypothetical protein [Deltaproteobacteria bacterium]